MYIHHFLFLFTVVPFTVLILIWWTYFSAHSSTLGDRIPISVNYHFIRQCNRSCGFCFHTATTSYRLPLNQAKRGLAKLRGAGMKKINFAGGEPFLCKRFLGNLIEYCKDELEVECVSIVTNGSLVDRRFLERYGRCIDILAVSCDSFHEETNIEIGRGSGNQVDKLFDISNWCREFNIKFKLNTVVCRMNFAEDMNSMVQRLQPFRWKCFQVLAVAGENDSADTLRDVRRFQISDEEFRTFCERHKDVPSFVPEPNDLMAKSYLILDEYMRFLSRDGRSPSPSILDVGVYEALEHVCWDEVSFVKRGGIYDWSSSASRCSSKSSSDLEW